MAADSRTIESATCMATVIRRPSPPVVLAAAHEIGNDAASTHEADGGHANAHKQERCCREDDPGIHPRLEVVRQRC